MQNKSLSIWYFWYSIFINNKISGAVFDKDPKYRYLLWRIWEDWDIENPPAMVQFIGLNPSTADEIENDPTVTRCINYAKDWGYDGMFMSNIFAWRDTNPKNMKVAEKPIGQFNDNFLLTTHQESAITVACWGNHGAYKNRGDEVMRLIPDLYILSMTKIGHPSHPLYLKKDLVPIELGL